MVRIRKTFLLFITLLILNGIKADEGMWMLPLVEQLNMQKMQQMGLTMTAEEIYSDKNISLKDAIIIFGNGCTGVVVSNQGLIFTNHHCGYGAIQRLSSVENNYLRDGFTAAELEDEIPSPGLTVRFLVSITDVTDRVMAELNNNMSADVRKKTQDSITNVIRKEFGDGNDYQVLVRSFYSENEFFVFMLEEFNDVRLAHTPPNSIGKFGGDTDNWMWPRQTGDYAVFRVYANAEGKPAAYNPDNTPYLPKRPVAISTKGFKEGDFAMIMGNPGSTSRYLTSWGIENRMNATNRSRIDIRGVKQDVWRSFMKENEAINIAYASKFASSSNYWKNSIGMNQAIEKLGVLDRKREEEKAFETWTNATPERKALYGNVLPQMKEHYAKVFSNLHASGYLREALVMGVEMPRMAGQIEQLINNKIATDSILIRAKAIYRDYFAEVDEATFALMLETYRDFVEPRFLPDLYLEIDKKFKGDYRRYTTQLFVKSDFSTFEKLEKKLRSGKVNLKKDPALQFRRSVDRMLASLNNDDYIKSMEIIRDAERLYEAGLKEINTANGTKRYPDANFTMRLTYGSILGYSPADAVKFDYYSTTRGILEKEIPDDMEFDVPPALKQAILNRDFGIYADEATGELFVNFLSNNDITGGNSGSPIFNGKGELLGLAFDGNWEAMSGDIVFEPELQRTINVDVRYMLFIMDKIGGADRLIKELIIN